MTGLFVIGGTVIVILVALIVEFILFILSSDKGKGPLNFLTSTLCRTMVFLATIAMGGLVVLVEALVIALLAIV